MMSIIYFVGAIILASDGYEMMAAACFVCSTAYDIYSGLKQAGEKR